MRNVAKTHPLPVPSFTWAFQAHVADFQHSYPPSPTWSAHPDPISNSFVVHHCLAKLEHNLSLSKLRNATELATSAVIHQSKTPAPDLEVDAYTVDNLMQQETCTSTLFIL